MYTYHFDYPNQQWNVFQMINGQEYFYRSFKSLDEAQECCARKNIAYSLLEYRTAYERYMRGK
jgi:hypothetical protein